MDTFRWSDGHSYAIEFRGEENAFIKPAMDALKTFHAETAKKYHDGKSQTDTVHFRQAELHIMVNGNWRQLKHDGALVVFPITVENTPESIAEMYQRLEPELFFKQQMIWRRVDTVYTNESNMIQFLSGFSDMLREATSDEPDDNSD